MLTVLTLVTAALAPPPLRQNAALTGRRAAMQTATSAALLPLFNVALPANAVDDKYGNDNEIGFNGALRGDIPATITGSGVEILITDQKYKELDACPPNFFVPTKEGPWTCLEITVTATNNVCQQLQDLFTRSRHDCDKTCFRLMLP